MECCLPVTVTQVRIGRVVLYLTASPRPHLGKVQRALGDVQVIVDGQAGGYALA